MYKDLKTLIEAKNCEPEHGLVILDILELFSGKWKMAIIGCIMHDRLRFTEIQKLIPNITPRMLSKELKDLEMMAIVKRTVYGSIPVLIQYSLTDSAKELEEPMIQLIEWGVRHRKQALMK
jgi:DNA-binding HxlR family transcriptional regulator